jgi:hypothetical protein
MLLGEEKDKRLSDARMDLKRGDAPKAMNILHPRTARMPTARVTVDLAADGANEPTAAGSGGERLGKKRSSGKKKPNARRGWSERAKQAARGDDDDDDDTESGKEGNRGGGGGAPGDTGSGTPDDHPRTTLYLLMARPNARRSDGTHYDRRHPWAMTTIYTAVRNCDIMMMKIQGNGLPPGNGES